MNLEQMELTDLADLSKKLDALATAGQVLIAAGFDPSFAVSEWTPAITVPPLGAAAREISRHAEARRPVEPPRICQDGPRSRQDLTAFGTCPAAAPPRAWAESDQAAEVTTEPTGEVNASPLDPVALPDASPPASGQEEPAPQGEEAPQLAAGQAPAASAIAPVPTGVMSDTLKPAPYTEEQIDWAITTFLDMLDRGATQEDAIKAIATLIGRTPDAIKNRLYTAWKRRLQEARDDRARARAAATHVSPITQAAPQAKPQTEAAPEPSAFEDPLVQRISTLRMPPQWDFAADLRMMAMKVDGLDAKTIAVNLEVAPKLVESRLAQLTSGGTYPPAQLLRALQAVVAEQKKGRAA